MDKVLKYVFWVLAAGMGLLLAACAGRPEAEEFMAPELGGCVVRTDGYTATISCLISGGHDIRKSGFIFGKEGDAGQVFPVSPAMGALSMEVKGLEPGTAYAVSAFVSSGQCEVSTQPVSFAIKETDPIVRIPDEGFREYCLRNFDRNEDGVISANEAFAIKKIDLVTESISSLEGIEQFTQLEWLHVSGSGVDDGKRTGRLTTLDLRQNKNLSYVKVYGNNLKELLLPEKYSDIETIQCSVNWIESLNLSGCPKLKTLYCWDNNLTGLDLSCNPALQDLRCTQNYFSDGLDLEANRNLKYLYCNDDCLRTLDLKDMAQLTEVGFWGNELESVNLSGCSSLRVIEGSNTSLNSLDISSCTKLRTLCVSYSNISSIDVSMCPELEEFDVGWTKVASIDVTNNPLLRHFSSCDLNLNSCPNLSNNPLLTSIHIWGKGGIVYVPEDFFRSWPDVESINIGCYDKDRLDLSQNSKLRDVWADCLENLHCLDLSASPGLEHISIRYSDCLDTVFVHPSVDLSRLDINMREDEVSTKFVHKNQQN